MGVHARWVGCQLNRTVTRDGQGSAQHRRGLPTHKTAVANACVVGVIGQGIETCIVIGRDGQRRRRDGGARCPPYQAVVGGTCTGQLHTSLVNRHSACIRAAKHGVAHQGQATIDGVVSRECRGVRRAVVGAGHSQAAVACGITSQRRSHQCRGVIDLGQACGGGQFHIQWADARRRCTLTRDGVVAHVSAGVGAGERDGFARGGVFVAEHAGGSHVQHVVGH